MNLVPLTACADPPSSERSPTPDARCISTLPYAISKWAEQSTSKPSFNEPRKSKLNTKSESESSIAKSSPREVRRKLSLLEEKRAIFQRRLFETTKDTDSGDTVVAVTVDDEERTPAREEKREGSTKKRARHISVKKFDTFSTFEGTFDEETGVGYLAGIEEDYTESYDRQGDNYTVAMGPTQADNAEKSKVASQDSTVRNSFCTHGRVPLLAPIFPLFSFISVSFLTGTKFTPEKYKNNSIVKRSRNIQLQQSVPIRIPTRNSSNPV